MQQSATNVAPLSNFIQPVFRIKYGTSCIPVHTSLEMCAKLQVLNRHWPTLSTLLLQTVAKFFRPVGPLGLGELDARVQARLNNIRDAIAVTQWADTLPHILTTVETYSLRSCQDGTFDCVQALAFQLDTHSLGALGFQEAASILRDIREHCGELSGAEKLLFKTVNACAAFWAFIKQEKFFGM